MHGPFWKVRLASYSSPLRRTLPQGRHGRGGTMHASAPGAQPCEWPGVWHAVGISGQFPPLPPDVRPIEVPTVGRTFSPAAQGVGTMSETMQVVETVASWITALVRSDAPGTGTSNPRN